MSFETFILYKSMRTKGKLTGCGNLFPDAQWLPMCKRRTVAQPSGVSCMTRVQ